MAVRSARWSEAAAGLRPAKGTGRGMMAGADRTGGGALLAALGGVALVLLGLTRRSWPGRAVAILPGLALGAWAAGSLGGGRRGEHMARGVGIEQRVRVGRAPLEVYAFFRDFRNLPSFMTHTHDVWQDAQGRIHWVALVPSGMRVEWDGDLIDDEPGSAISWKSVPGEPFEETGSVVFEPAADGGTDVTLRLAYDFHGPAGMAAADALKGVTNRTVAEELDTLKRLLESEPPKRPGRDEAAPAGRRRSRQPL